MFGTRGAVDLVALVEELLVGAGVALGRGDEADRAVAVLVVVPTYHRIGKGARRHEVVEWLDGVLGTVLEGSKERFRVGVVVADRGSTQRARHAQLLEGGDQRGALHWRAVVGMHSEFSRRDLGTPDIVFKERAGVLLTFLLEHLPGDDLAAGHVQEYIQIQVDAANQGRQIGDIPADQLVGCGGAERTRGAARMGASLRGLPHRVAGDQ